jgi:hypothetical protein
MGGTTELAGNFVPVDERLVSFFVFKKGVQRTKSFAEVRGILNSTSLSGVQRTKSFAGVWGVPTYPFFSPPQAARKAEFT